jgi:hypothetical protein
MIAQRAARFSHRLMPELIPAADISDRILNLRGYRVLLDTDLAVLYGVPVKRLLEQVRRNQERFPRDFCFRLTAQEVAALRSQFATSNKGRGGRRYHPFAFTEHGALMASNVLNSSQAIQMSILIARAFIRMRDLMLDPKTLASRLADLHAHLGIHDEQIAAIIEAIRQLTVPVGPAHDEKIGYHRGNR